jgi:GxxExxY protein
MTEMTEDKLTEIIIGCAYKIHKALGTGFIEKIYRKSLAIEIAKNGLKVEQESPIQVMYEEHVVGDFYADLLIEDRLIVEIKAVQTLLREHEVQLVNYLTATGIDTGLLLNFGAPVQVKRKHRIFKAKHINPVHLVNPVKFS